MSIIGKPFLADYPDVLVITNPLDEQVCRWEISVTEKRPGGLILLHQQDAGCCHAAGSYGRTTNQAAIAATTPAINRSSVASEKSFLSVHR